MVGGDVAGPGSWSNIDDELFAVVGRAVAAGATLEWAITELHATLLHSPRGLAAVAGEGVDRARSACLELASLVGEPVEGMVRRALEPVHALWQRRNALVHGAWLAGSHLGDPARSGVTVRAGRRGLATYGWSVTSLAELTVALSDVSGQVGDVTRALDTEPDLRGLLGAVAASWRLGPPKVW